MTEDSAGGERRHSNDALLARMEADLRHIMRCQDIHERKLEKIDAQEKQEKEETLAFREEVRAGLAKLTNELTRYRGFVGGMLFVAAAIGAFITTIKSWIAIKVGWVQ